MRNTQSSSTPQEQETLKTDELEASKKGKSKDKDKSKPLVAESLSYESALEELKALVQKLESGQLPLDDLFFVYQRGAELLQICKQKLQVVEDQVQVLQKQGEAQVWKSEA